MGGGGGLRGDTNQGERRRWVNEGHKKTGGFYPSSDSNGSARRRHDDGGKAEYGRTHRI